MGGPKVIDSRITTPTLSRRDFSQSREAYSRPPVPPPRDSSLHLPFGSYAEIGIHTKAPNRYGSAAPSMRTSRRSVTPGPNLSSYRAPVPSQASSAYSAGRRNSVSLTSSNTYSSSSSSTSRQRHYSTSASYGTPAASRGIPFY